MEVESMQKLDFLEYSYVGYQNVKTSFTYLAACVPPLSSTPVYKIGVSARPTERLYCEMFGKPGVATQYPFPVYLLAAYQSCGAEGVENRLHRLHEDAKYQGMYGDGSTEWFEIEDYNAYRFIEECIELEPYKMREDVGRKTEIVSYEDSFEVGNQLLWASWYRDRSNAAKYFQILSVGTLKREYMERKTKFQLT